MGHVYQHQQCHRCGTSLWFWLVPDDEDESDADPKDADKEDAPTCNGCKRDIALVSDIESAVNAAADRIVSAIHSAAARGEWPN